MESIQLELTPVDEAEREAEQQKRITQYRRQYWQRYKMQHKRVYGTVTPEEFAELKVLANANGRSVWEEIWRQSKAYRNKTYLPPETIRTEIEKLYAELRQVNDNLNRIGNQNGRVGRVLTQNKVADQLKALEQRIEHFTAKPWIAP